MNPRDRQDALAIYRCHLTKIKCHGKSMDINTEKVEDILRASLNNLDDLPTSANTNGSNHHRWKHCFNSSTVSFVLSIALLLILIFVYIMISYHKPSYNVIARNIQDLIYPIMKILRLVSLPMVRVYPSVTAVYDESCLVKNPFFNYREIDCWPCTNIYSPIDLSKCVDNPKSLQPHSAYPFFMKGISPQVTFTNLKEMYWEQYKMFDKEASQISSSVKSWMTINNIMEQNLEEAPSLNQDAHVLWRINRLEAIRAVRKLFKRPKFVPPWVTVERFILIDEQRSPAYIVPTMESFNIFIMQGSGERLLALEPVYPCMEQCSTIAIHMKQSYFLFYSSLYYTLRSYPVNASENISISVAYIGSY